jgi:hypothetical protein
MSNTRPHNLPQAALTIKSQQIMSEFDQAPTGRSMRA